LGNRELLFLPHKPCQTEVCTGRAALAGARVMKKRAGEIYDLFGSSTFLIPGAFAPRAAHYCAGSALKPLKSLVPSTAVVQAR
jgi:hypothetical protein